MARMVEYYTTQQSTTLLRDDDGGGGGDQLYTPVEQATTSLIGPKLVPVPSSVGQRASGQQ